MVGSWNGCWARGPYHPFFSEWLSWKACWARRARGLRLLGDFILWPCINCAVSQQHQHQHQHQYEQHTVNCVCSIKRVVSSLACRRFCTTHGRSKESKTANSIPCSTCTCKETHQARDAASKKPFKGQIFVSPSKLNQSPLFNIQPNSAYNAPNKNVRPPCWSAHTLVGGDLNNILWRFSTFCSHQRLILFSCTTIAEDSIRRCVCTGVARTILA